ncbi:hypothetical protein TNCV_373941 [Trichonephila clavipes]|nr:hypothetical protein TNCV_373941 [Trichonephila clavipes]
MLQGKGIDVRLSLSIALSTMRVTVRLVWFQPMFEGENPEGGVKGSQFSSPYPNLTKEFQALRLFRVDPCPKGTIYLQTSMPFPRFEPRTYGTAVNVDNQYSGRETEKD